MTAADRIATKRDGGAWDAAAIAEIAAGIAAGSFSDAQVGALAMAVYLQGCTAAETAALTLAMRDSGRVLDLSALPGKKVDKHSTGGVGDKVSLLLAPWVAAAGVTVPMISGRGLGHTGGTLDKLEAIPGFRTALSPEDFVAVVRDCGFAMAGAGAELAPADRRLYAIRDVTATVASIPLIVSSILSKKLAAGIDALVLDVKCGRAAFLPERARAERLLAALVEVGSAAGLAVTALLTDMDRPLGRAVGNAVEVAEIVACLAGRGPPDLLEVTRALAVEMLLLAGTDADAASAAARLDALLAGGQVRERLARNIARQGGDPACLDDPSRLPTAPLRRDVPSPASGFVVDIDPLAIGRAAMDLGAGRRRGDDPIDPAVGIVLACAAGDPVANGAPLATVHARDDAGCERATAAIRAAITIGDTAPRPASRILARVAGSAG